MICTSHHATVVVGSIHLFHRHFFDQWERKKNYIYIRENSLPVKPFLLLFRRHRRLFNHWIWWTSSIDGAHNKNGLVFQCMKLCTFWVHRSALIKVFRMNLNRLSWYRIYISLKREWKKKLWNNARIWFAQNFESNFFFCKHRWFYLFWFFFFFSSKYFKKWVFSIY